jgi:hypothetical protein
MNNRFINILELLVNKRFKNLKEVKKNIEQKTNCKINLIQSWKNKEKDEYDFLMVGNIDNNDLFCDFDIYYTKSKNHILITEVSYEFE